MTKRFLSLLFFTIIFWSSYGQDGSTTKTLLSVAEFAEKINNQHKPQIVDVRTPEEFAKGHLINASNYDWKSSNFDKQISQLDKSKPLFVYCLSGGRSSAAAKKLRTDGFKIVFELDGGIMKWRSANMAETTNSSNFSVGMTKQQYEELLKSEKFVLVDFYADWCAPCQKMKPYLEEIAKDMNDKVVVVRINCDDNKLLCKELKIDALPVLNLYENRTLTWTNRGYISKNEVVKHLK